MENEITVQVRIVPDGDGRFVGRAIGFSGVIASGDTEEQTLDRVGEAWFAIYRAKQTKTSLKPTGAKPFMGRIYEKRLQLA